jgi:hypothetical protein
MRRDRKGTGISRRLERFKDRAKPMNIGIPLYPDFDPLDVIGPYEIFSWMARMWGEQRLQGHNTLGFCFIAAAFPKNQGRSFPDNP